MLDRIQKMITKKYKMSFSTGGIFYQESIILTKLYLDCLDWNVVKIKVLEGNLLQTRTESSAKRILREVITRLQCLSQKELIFLFNTERREQNSILWIAVCRNYCFIKEFSTEVIREKFINFQYNIEHNDFDVFFYNKMDWHEELESISDSTRKKLRQVLFKMLREVGIIGKDKSIIPSILSPQLIDIMQNSTTEDFNIFPIIG